MVKQRFTVIACAIRRDNGLPEAIVLNMRLDIGQIVTEPGVVARKFFQRGAPRRRIEELGAMQLHLEAPRADAVRVKSAALSEANYTPTGLEPVFLPGHRESVEAKFDSPALLCPGREDRRQAPAPPTEARLRAGGSNRRERPCTTETHSVSRCRAEYMRGPSPQIRHARAISVLAAAKRAKRG